MQAAPARKIYHGAKRRAMFQHPSEFVTFKASPHLPGVELYSARLVNHSFAPHVHDGYSLGAIEAGVERFRYKGSEHVAPAGTLVMLNPDELHTGEAEVDAGWTYQMLYIEPQVLHEMAGSEAFFRDATAHDPAIATAYRRLFRKMWEAPDDIAFLSDFTRLVDTIVTRYGRNARLTPQVSPQQTCRAAAMRRVLDYIEANLEQNIGVDVLATEAGLSLFHFVRTFSSAFHVTPHQYVQARRAARAKTLLAGRATPSDAAAAAGLTDQSHLNRWFKRTYGVTPAQYQQQIGTRPAAARRR
jgi:AraC-like DNA-binding protein